MKKLLINKLLCGWFGCKDSFVIKTCADEEYYFNEDNQIPCIRCLAPNTTLNNRCGESKHHSLIYFFRYQLWLRWEKREKKDRIIRWMSIRTGYYGFRKCQFCGKRYCTNEDCLPF